MTPTEPLYSASSRTCGDKRPWLQADELALRLAADEFDRAGRFWTGHGLPALGAPTLHAHLAAAVTLASGLRPAAAAWEMIAR